MSNFVIPKKSSMSVNFPKPFSPILHESFKNEAGETARAEGKLSAGAFGVPSDYFGVPTSVLAARPAVRPPPPGKTILKTGNRGGKLMGLGGEICRGAKSMKNFQLRVQSSDNKKIFKSLGPAKPAAKQCVQTIPKKD